MPNDETAARPAPGEATPSVPSGAAPAGAVPAGAVPAGAVPAASAPSPAVPPDPAAAVRPIDPDEDAPTDPEQAAALSRAARDAVRQPADPRIDRQLARMGLAPEPEPEAAEPARVGRAVRAEDVEALERRVAELAPLTGRVAALEAIERRVTTAESAAQDAELAAVRARRRVDQLAWVVTAEGVAIVILTALLLLR